MPKCSYCGKDYEFPRGLTLVRNDGNAVFLCSAKCRKNMEMKKRKVRWVVGASKVKSSTKTKKTKKKVSKKRRSSKKKK